LRPLARVLIEQARMELGARDKRPKRKARKTDREKETSEVLRAIAKKKAS